MLEAQPDTRLIVLGDLNDYALSPALLTLTEDGGLVNALLQLPEEERYTYTFSGAAQLLDYLLFSPTAAEEVVWVGVIHMNADYPVAWSNDSATALRVSDHDVPMALLALPAETEEAVAESRDVLPTTQPDEPRDTPAAESEEPASIVETGSWSQVLLVGAMAVVVLIAAFWLIRARRLP